MSKLNAREREEIDSIVDVTESLQMIDLHQKIAIGSNQRVSIRVFKESPGMAELLFDACVPMMSTLVQNEILAGRHNIN